jgi:DNA-binding transcriptional MerR regulator
MKEFNITTTCIKEEHYMVDISDKLKKIKQLIDKNKYFTINKARQYGKTTIMSRLFFLLQDEYIIIPGSLEDFGEKSFETEARFSKAFLNMLKNIIKFQDEDLSDFIGTFNNIENFQELSLTITEVCMKSKKEIVLMIDEIDKASNNIVFLDFLSMLRDKYNKQKNRIDKTFKSVILAGVHDVKNLKVHIKERRVLTVEESRLVEKTTFNSPWNVAEKFNIDIGFNIKEIASMLEEYDSDNKLGMDINKISKEIFNYTYGYPFLVSNICKVVDEEFDKNWTIIGIKEAVKKILKERNTLYDSLIKNIENNKELYSVIYYILIEGGELSYVQTDEIINIAETYGIIRENDNGKVQIHNKIFEILLYNHMSIKKERESFINKPYESSNIFITDKGELNIELVLEKFQDLMKQEHRKETEKFIEKEGRLIFLAFLKPIINGSGFYYVEAETRSNKRFDIVITYNSKEYIIELKKFYDKVRKEKGYDQLAEYIEIKGLIEGYLIVFDFRKNKKYIKRWLDVNEKNIFEVIV